MSQKVLAVDLDLGAGPFAEQHPVARFDVKRNELAAFVTGSPGPTAMTSPSCGFSLAVSGMMMPPFVLSSPSMRRMTMRATPGRANAKPNLATARPAMTGYAAGVLALRQALKFV